MNNYLNSECPYCGKKFTENDDIVVCPDCGTPHHRGCYKEHGVCANNELHGGFEWKSSSEPRTPENKGGNEQKFDSFACPNCGGMNPSGTKFCSNCGAPLSSEHGASRRPEFTVTRIDGMNSDIDDMIEELEKSEEQESILREKEFNKRISELDKEWEQAEKELQEVIRNICPYLTGRDAKALQSAPYENKSTILLMSTEDYEDLRANEMRVAANRIAMELLPKMKKAQLEAKRLKEERDFEAQK